MGVRHFRWDGHTHSMNLSRLRLNRSCLLSLCLPAALACAATIGGCVRQSASSGHTPTPLESSLANVRRHPKDPAARQELADRYAGAGQTFAACVQWEVART